MKTRGVYIEEGKALADSGVYPVDIKPGAPLSAIELIFGGTKGATENQSDKLQEYITSLELRNGSDILWSLPMTRAVALNCFEMKQKPAHEYDLSASGTPQESCWINFGRFLFDPEYYLDCTPYPNLQLRITTAMTAAAGTYATGTITVDVILHVMDEGAQACRGFMSAKEAYSWTTVASGDEQVDIDMTYPIRFLLVGMGEDNIAIATDVTNLKLTADSDRHIIFDYDTADLLLRNRTQFGAFLEYIKSTMQDTDTLDSSFHDIIGAQIMGGDEDFGVRLASVTGNRMTFSFYAQT